MKILIYGDGNIGISLAANFAAGDNDVVVIAENREKLQSLADTLDIQIVLGKACYPSLLEEVNARSADVFIAADSCDENNILACQVARNMFQIPLTMAYIHNYHYLSFPLSQLFAQSPSPIDHIISPEVGLAQSIVDDMSVSGATKVITIPDQKAKVYGLRIQKLSPIKDKKIASIEALLPSLPFRIMTIKREGAYFFPDPEFVVMENDELFVVLDENHIGRLLDAFSISNSEVKNLVLMGAGNVGFNIATYIQEKDLDLKIKFIEFNSKRAKYIASQLSDTVVLEGSALDSALLEEANVSKADYVLALMNDDETNVLAALLAKKAGAPHVAVLTSNLIYQQILPSLEITRVIDPKEITITQALASIPLHHVHLFYGFSDNQKFLCIGKVTENSHYIGKPITYIQSDEKVYVGGLIREDHFLVADNKTLAKAGDSIIFLAVREEIDPLTKLF